MRTVVLCCLLALCAGGAYKNHTLVAGFKWLNYAFPTEEEAQEYFDNGNYTCCMLAGVKVNSKGKYFVSVPRWTPNVPATMNVLQFSDPPLLQPFPSWSANEMGVASALQSVLGFEIDAEDRIWVLDQGKINSEPAIPGSQKLVVYDSNSGSEIMRFDLTSVTDPQRSFLNDVVVDTFRQVAYITDSGIPSNPQYPVKGALIVIDYANNRTRRVLDSDPSVTDDMSLWVSINGQRVNQNSPMETGADGIALSCDGTMLYYTPLTSRTLYAIRTEYLRDWTLTNLSSYAVDLGYKISASDGLASTYKGHLYLTAIETSSVYLYDEYPESMDDFDYRDLEIASFDPVEGMWPDTIGFDDTDRSLVFVSNQLHHFVGHTMNFLDPVYGDYNFRIWKLAVNDRSYVHGCSDGSSSDTSSGFPGWAIAVLIVGCVVIVSLGGVACWKYRQGQKYDKDKLIFTHEQAPSINS